MTTNIIDITKVGKVGVIINSKDKKDVGCFVRIMEDKDHTGGYLIYISSGKEFGADDTIYDYWIEKKEDLNSFGHESGWEIEWNK
jgi:hypothetical protein